MKPVTDEVVVILVALFAGSDISLLLLPLVMVLASGDKSCDPSSIMLSNFFRAFFSFLFFPEVICFTRFIADLVPD
jgi:hypothetical protein